MIDVDTAKRTCTLGSTKDKHANAIAQVSKAYSAGEGVLDISTPVVDADGNLWRITTWISFCLIHGNQSLLVDAITGDYKTKGFAKKIIVPKTFTTFGGRQAFNGAGTGLETIVIDCPDVQGRMDAYCLGGDSVSGCTGLETVTFTGMCKMDAGKAKGTLDTILASVPAKTADGKMQTMIRASVHAGWKSVVSGFEGDEGTDAKELEVWLPANERIVGVYVTKDGVRKAWFVHVPNEEYDPKGTIIIVR